MRVRSRYINSASGRKLDIENGFSAAMDSATRFLITLEHFAFTPTFKGTLSKLVLKTGS